MYDRSTRSLWSQVLGAAIAGPLKGTKLRHIQSELTTWGNWKSRHPDTLVLVKPPKTGSVYRFYFNSPEMLGVAGSKNPDSRLEAKELVYGMRRGDSYAAVPFSVLEKHRVFNTEAFGIPVVLFSPQGEKAAMAFKSTVDGKSLRFEAAPGKERLRVRESTGGSEWSWADGSCVQGPMEGKKLKRITGTAVFWGIWGKFHPKTELIRKER
jgi:uncharacterized protein DUF3179